jgi:hypothetical protein
MLFWLADPGGRALPRRGSAATRLLGLQVRIPPGAWMSVSLSVVCCCQVEVSTTGQSLVQGSPTESLGGTECGQVQQ